MTIVKDVTIKLVSIDFVPTWEDEHGFKNTVIGPWQISADALPLWIQEKLIAICRQATVDHFQDPQEGHIR